MNELKHYGILGQKWGVRRFQKEDGTLTPAGKIQYGTTKSVLESGSKILGDASRLATSSSGKSKTVNKKTYDNLTDEELRKKVSRLNLEEQYSRLTGDAKKVRNGAEWVHEILQDSAIVVGIASTAIGIYMMLKSARG
jgi:hypothetical protein